jgi:hypothetical protein
VLYSPASGDNNFGAAIPASKTAGNISAQMTLGNAGGVFFYAQGNATFALKLVRNSESGTPTTTLYSAALTAGQTGSWNFPLAATATDQFVINASGTATSTVFWMNLGLGPQ